MSDFGDDIATSAAQTIHRGAPAIAEIIKRISDGKALAADEPAPATQTIEQVDCATEADAQRLVEDLAERNIEASRTGGSVVVRTRDLKTHVAARLEDVGEQCRQASQGLSASRTTPEKTLERRLVR